MELEYSLLCIIALKDLGKIIRRLKEWKSVKREFIKDIIIKIINRAEENSSGIMENYMWVSGKKA